MKVNTVKRARAVGRRAYYKNLAAVGTVMALSPIGAAFATGGGDMPADLDSADAWVRAKIAIGVLICLSFTLGALAFKGTKLPRKA